MPTIYPRTFDGDQIRVKFPNSEELNAFESALNAMRNHLESSSKKEVKKTKEIFQDFKLSTTLQAEVINDRDNREIMKKILGIDVLNVLSKDDVVMVRYIKSK